MLCLAALTPVACTETYEVRGRQVRVEADAGLSMCAGTLEHMDRFVERFAAELGLPLTGEPWIDYRWMTSENLAERNPCAGMPACAVVRTVYASEIPHEHELIHSAASDLGLAHPFFIEGLAVAFEGGTRDEVLIGEPHDDEPDDATTTGEVEPPPGVLAVLREDYVWLPGEYYLLAGAFTRYLIDRFGLRDYFEFYRRTWYADPYTSLARSFATVFKTTLADAAVAFEVERVDCRYAGYRFKLLECEAPALAWDGERLARYFTIDCDDPAAIGEAGVNVRVLHSFEVPRDGRYRVELRDPAWASVTIGSCGGCERQAITRLGLYRGLLEVDLPAGRYFLRAETASASPVTFGLVMERVPE